jgi:beta-glucanase (GH16 family)
MKANKTLKYIKYAEAEARGLGDEYKDIAVELVRLHQTVESRSEKSEELDPWREVYVSDFSQNELDPNVWKLDKDFGWWDKNNGFGNKELGFSKMSNIEFKDGMMHIHARKDSNTPLGYSSARINTDNLFEQQYGRIEARIKVAGGKGLLSQFWLQGAERNRGRKLGWPTAGEIDIVEVVGHQPKSAHFNMHLPIHGFDQAYNNYNRKQAKGTHWHDEELHKGFHTYTFEWNDSEAIWYFDGEIAHRAKKDELGKSWVLDQPFWIILNLSVGGNWPGNDIDLSVNPVMIVDYVKTYQKQSQIK